MAQDRAVEYRAYIDGHIKNIEDVWKVARADIRLWLPSLIEKVDDLVSKHDRSKYEPEEFDAYRNWFYPEPEEHPQKEAFSRAWALHFQKNPHHWEHWLKVEDGVEVPKDMEIPYILEMLCDWAAMSMKFGDTPSEFYSKKKEEFIITELTRAYVEYFLHFFDSAVSRLKRIREYRKYTP